jgi:hypothetical protein
MSELQVAYYQPTLIVSAPATATVGPSAIAAGSLTSQLTSGGMPTTANVTYSVYGPSPSYPTTCQTTTGGGWHNVGSASVIGSGASGASSWGSSVALTSAGDYWWYASFPGDANKVAATSNCSSTMTETTVPVGVADLVSTAASTNTLTSGVTPASGSTVLLLVYADGTSAPAISSVGGAAISGSPTLITSAAPGGSGSNYGEWAYWATATGSSGVTVTLNSATTYIHLDVLQLTGNNTATPIAQDKNSTTPNKSPTAALLAAPAAGDVEVALNGAAANDGGAGATPSGWTSISAVPIIGSPPYGESAYYTSSPGTGTQVFAFGSNVAWATITLDIGY